MRRCRASNVELVSARGNQRYCSVRCKNRAAQARLRDAARKPLSPRRCEHCGRDFQPGRPDHLYCSADCRYNAQLARYHATPRAKSPSPKGLAGRVLSMVSCEKIQAAAEKLGLREPEVSLPEMVNRLPERTLRGLLRRGKS